jgi:4,5-DOPA dioxygenase extradiol
MTTRLPAIFFGHGNPLNAIDENDYTRAWRKIGEAVPRPEAVVAISAHWYLPGVAVTTSSQPRTIHDFGGFPRQLYEVSYPAPGDPALASRMQELLAPVSVLADESWGLDHGTWSVLCHVFPDADVPVIQLRIDETQPGEFHYELGRKLSGLRDEGVLLVGSGNLVHNLHTYAWGRHPVDPYDWAVRFETNARSLIEAHEHAPLVNYASLGRDALLSVPTPEHYLPLLYVLGARRDGEKVTFPVEGVDGGSVSMLAVQVG